MARKPDSGPMAGHTIVSCDLTLKQDYARSIADSVAGDDSPGRKISSVAAGLLEQIAEGGIMVPPAVVRKMQDSLGRSPEVEDLLEYFEKGLKRKDGHLTITIHTDPVDEPVLRESAEFNGYADPEQYMQRLWDDAWDAGWFHPHQTGTARVLMSETDYGALKTLLGGDFANGTELAALVEKYAKAQINPLFEEVVK